MSDDLRSALEAAFEDKPEETTTVETVSQQPDTELTNEPVERVRDESGKFSSKEAQAPTDEPVSQVPVEPEIKPPSSWKPEAKEAYIKAERGEQLTAQEIKLLTAEANRRESDYHKGLENYKSHAQRAREFEQALQPYQQTIQQMGLDGPTAAARMLQVEHTLRYADPATKAQMLNKIATDYGIDMGMAQQVPQQDPQTQYLMQQLNELRNTQQMWQNTIQQQEREKANYELTNFSSTGEKTHFEAVRNDMADLLEAGKAQSLEQAYEMAIWMRPDVRQTLIEQQRIEAQKKYEEQQRATRAKTASVSVKGSSPSSSGSQPVSGSLRDILSAQFAQ